MTLRKRIFLCILCVFVLVFIGVFFIGVKNTQRYLQKQLEAHAQDTATSLGASLAVHAEKIDIPAVSTRIDAVFDRGDYQEIALKNLNGRILVERSQNVKKYLAPKWFRHIVEIKAPVASALVMSGWKQVGVLTVQTNTRLAYQELWRTAKALFAWFLLAILLALLASSILLRRILHPLGVIVSQAEGICRREFPIENKIPEMKELRTLSEAMNKMVLRLKEMFKEEAKLADKLRHKLHQDELTGLANRSYFNRKFEGILKNEGGCSGALLLIELQPFKEFNDISGYEAGNKLLLDVSDILKTFSVESGGELLARLRGANFALVVPAHSLDERKKLANALLGKLSEYIDSATKNKILKVFIGVAKLQKNAPTSAVLFAADFALKSVAGSASHAVGYFSEEKKSKFLPAGEWRAWIESILKEQRIALYSQPVLTCDSKTILHDEVLLRVPEQNKEFINAGAFLPVAEKFQLSKSFDALVISKLMGMHESGQPLTHSKAVNLSAQGFLDEEFFAWLIKQVDDAKIFRDKLIFEVPESVGANYLELAADRIKALESIGVQLGFDHYGQHFHSYTYFQHIKLAYVKLDSFYSRNIAKDQDNQFYVQSLLNTAHSVDLKVIATEVETEQEFEALAELGVDGVQGRFVTSESPLG